LRGWGIILIFLTTHQALARPPVAPISDESFMRSIEAREHQLVSSPDMEFLRTAIGKTLYLPLSWLCPGQDEFSLKVARQKIHQAVKRWKLDDGGALPFDAGRSLVSKKAPARAEHTPDCVMLADGNHHAIMSLFLGAQSFPVHLERIREHHEYPRHFSELKDNVYLYVARLITARVKFSANGRSLKWLRPQDPLRIIVLKDQNSPNYLERYVAQILEEHKVKYELQWGSHLPSNFLEESRRALAEEKRRGNPLLFGIPVMAQPPLIKTGKARYKIKKLQKNCGLLLGH
jgi:hypothetical protein